MISIRRQCTRKVNQIYISTEATDDEILIRRIMNQLWNAMGQSKSQTNAKLKTIAPMDRITCLKKWLVVAVAAKGVNLKFMCWNHSIVKNGVRQ